MADGTRHVPGAGVSRRHVNEHMFRHLLQNAPDESLPAFILWWEQDQVLHVSCADTFKTLIPEARLAVLPGVGHLPVVEPHRTASLLRRFWRDIRAGASPDAYGASPLAGRQAVAAGAHQVAPL